MSPYLYVPIVKGKKFDCLALTDLSQSSWTVTKPLLELLPFEKVKSVDNQLAAFVGRVADVTARGPVFVDMYGPNPGEKTSTGQLAVIAGLRALARQGLPVTPVYGFQRDDAVWPGLAKPVARLGNGFCFRIDADDLDDQAENTWSDIIERAAQLGQQPAHIDLLLDLRSLHESDLVQIENAVLDFLTLRPTRYQPRSLILAGSSALKDVTSVPGNGIGMIPRRELQLWARINADLADTSELIYADYGVVHPEFSPVISRNANAKIRYSTHRAIHYFRGRSLHQQPGPGFSQYHTLAKRVMDSNLFMGRDFSYGDNYIADCAARKVGTGNLSTWVRVDQSHHFEAAARQLTVLAPQVKATTSADAAQVLIAD